MPLELQLLILGAVSFLAGIASGISGGGAGMVMVPLSIGVGLSPQVAVATMKMAGLGASFGGLSAFLKSGHVRRDIVKVMIPIAVGIGLVTPIIFSQIESETFQTILGFILLLIAPTLFVKSTGLRPSKKKQGVGYVVYSFFLSLQALFGTGVGALSTFALTLLLGTTKLEANATKRAVTSVMVPVTFLGLLIAGYVSIVHGILLFFTGFVGTHIGTKIALKKGEVFVTYAMVILSVVSGAWLLSDAIVN